MNTLHLRDAQADLSAVVEAAEGGAPTLIMKQGRPAAMVVPLTDGRRLYPDERPSFADLLLSIPHDLAVERDPSPLRDVDLG